MTLTIESFARAQGISVQRARELARKGKVPARKEGRSWVVDLSAPRLAPSRRPLSARSQQDLIMFLNTRSFVHVTGYAKTRLAERVRALRDSDNPAEMLRELFANNQAPAGFGGAAIIRAAMKGKDEAANGIFRQLILRENLPTPSDVARKVSTARLLKGLSVYEAAELAGIQLEVFTALELRGEAALGSITAVKVLKALDVPLPSLVRAKTVKKVKENA